MKLEEAIEIITYYQSWRMGYIDDIDYTPKEISAALNKLLENANKKTKCDRKCG